MRIPPANVIDSHDDNENLGEEFSIIDCIDSSLNEEPYRNLQEEFPIFDSIDPSLIDEGNVLINLCVQPYGDNEYISSAVDYVKSYVQHLETFEAEVTQYITSDDLFIGQIFRNSSEFAKALKSFTIKRRFELKLVKINPQKIIARCSLKECQWKINVIKLAGIDTFRIKYLIGQYTCSRGISRRDHKQCTSLFIRDEVHKQTIEEIRGSYEESYKWLQGYLRELKKRGPNTVTKLQWANCGHFKCVFWAFGACLRSFKSHLWPLLGIDATFLISKYRGCLLFLYHLRVSIEPFEHMMILSDKQKGLIHAVNDAFPKAYYGYCMVHLSRDFSNVPNSSPQYNKFWAAAQAYREIEFNYLIEQMKQEFSQQYAYISKILISMWANYYFSGRRYFTLITNMFESLNNVIYQSKAMHIQYLMEMTR
ncbi:uncharacterized protein [Typha angustifolia]|uniref:uncharacterized protein n=1 Tax=Typha angustifolia TaxID=59011 RepID=UPI003C2EBC09